MTQKAVGPFSVPRENEDLVWLLDSISYHHRNLGSAPDEPINVSNLPHFFTEMREAWDRYREGNSLALLDALRLFQEKCIPVPKWLQVGLEGFIVSAVKGEALGTKGRGNSLLAKATDAVKRQKRYETFRRIRVAQKVASTPVLFAISLPPETSKLINSGKVADIGRTKEDALTLTEVSLRGTFAQASRETLRRMLKEYSETESEYIISHELQVAFGLANNDLPELTGGFSLLSAEQISTPSDE